MSRLYTDPRFWDVVRGFPLDAAWLWGYLNTHRYGQLVPGLLVISTQTLAAERRLEISKLEDALAPLLSEGLVSYDKDAELMRMPMGPVFAPKPGPTNIKGWYRHWLTVPESVLKAEHVASLRAVVPWGEGKTPSATAWVESFGSHGHSVVADTNNQIQLFSQVPRSPIDGGSITPYKKQKQYKDQVEDFSFSLPQTPEPPGPGPLPFTVDELLTRLGSSGCVATQPFDRRMAPAITAVIRECQTQALTMVDVELVADWLAAGGLAYRDDLGVAWVAKKGALIDAIAQARQWDRGGRQVVGRGRGHANGDVRRGRVDPAPPGAFTKGKQTL